MNELEKYRGKIRHDGDDLMKGPLFNIVQLVKDCPEEVVAHGWTLAEANEFCDRPTSSGNGWVYVPRKMEWRND